MIFWRRSATALLLAAFGLLALQGRPLRASGDSGLSSYTSGAGKTTFIFLAADKDQLSSYLALNDPQITVAYRSVTPDPSELDSYDAQHVPYYFTAASSDFVVRDQPLYVSSDVVDQVALRSGTAGFYLHEAVTYLASQHQYNWNQAVADFDWNWMSHLVSVAQARGEKVIWSEPALGWQTLFQSEQAQSYLSQWSSVVVPMFATNFPNDLDLAREYAMAEAIQYSMPFGESHQSWYFHDSVPSQPPTRQGSFDLAKSDAWDYGATYFQFEGTDDSLQWGSAYMLGVRDFAAYLSGQVAAPPAGT
jgi:hypothetical protein